MVATVGTLSGPAASTLRPVVDAAQVWVKFINNKGGLNGHQVKFFVYDDGGDPARHRGQVQDAIERQRVIAFLANAEPITGRGSVDYINSKRVPVVGTSGGVNYAYESPMYFPQASDGGAMYGVFLPAVADQVKDKHKLGIVYCAEAAASCAAAAKVMTGQAKSLGYQVVYQAQASIAQPDYTAECLAARNAGADVFMIILDSNSLTRMAASCVRQGYKPQFGTGGSIVLDRFKEDPNLEGMVASSQVFPYFQTGTPGVDEYQQALKNYGGGIGNGVAQATGWTAGKLLEKAAADLPEPPTSEAILAGLWALKDDTLGGLTYSLNFIKDKPAQPKSCWFGVAIRAGQWVSTDGFKLHCLNL